MADVYHRSLRLNFIRQSQCYFSINMDHKGFWPTVLGGGECVSPASTHGIRMNLHALVDNALSEWDNPLQIPDKLCTILVNDECGQIDLWRISLDISFGLLHLEQFYIFSEGGKDDARWLAWGEDIFSPTWICVLLASTPSLFLGCGYNEQCW